MRIGIVVPAYNAAPWIGDAIASVIAQTHRDWMLVVVDDGSTDGTAQRRRGLCRSADTAGASGECRGVGGAEPRDG